MMHDAIVDEVRAIREQLAAQFNFDIRAIVADAQKRQAASRARIVSFAPPNKPLPEPAKVVSGSGSSEQAVPGR
jgi:hypothetical protein